MSTATTPSSGSRAARAKRALAGRVGRNTFRWRAHEEASSIQRQGSIREDKPSRSDLAKMFVLMEELGFLQLNENAQAIIDASEVAHCH